MSAAYATLLYSDSYLPGAEVLGYRLSKLDPLRHRVALVTEDVSEATKTVLRQFWNTIETVETFSLGHSSLLRSMNRPELAKAPTKIALWRLPFDQVVYLDADTLPMVLPEALFEPLEEGWIAAAPDSGWPDIFNSGVLSLKPSDKCYKELLDFRSSFDGSDQGLLNEYFAGHWKRVPFTYNVTINGGYQYKPAYNHFRKDIRILHYIGPVKPWDGLPSPEWHEVSYELSKSRLPAEASSDSPADWNPDKVIEPPIDYWDATTHAPLSTNRPEGESLVVDEDKEEEPQPGGHVFPTLGPQVVDLPFEQEQKKAERVFY